MLVVDSEAAEAMLEAIAEVTPLVAAARSMELGVSDKSSGIGVNRMIGGELTGSTQVGLETQGGLLVSGGAAGGETGLLEGQDEGRFFLSLDFNLQRLIGDKTGQT